MFYLVGNRHPVSVKFFYKERSDGAPPPPKRMRESDDPSPREASESRLDKRNRLREVMRETLGVIAAEQYTFTAADGTTTTVPLAGVNAVDLTHVCYGTAVHGLVCAWMSVVCVVATSHNTHSHTTHTQSHSHTQSRTHAQIDAIHTQRHTLRVYGCQLPVHLRVISRLRLHLTCA